MGKHTTNLAKLKIQTAQQHLRAALEALKEEKEAEYALHLVAASDEIENAKALYK